jgi:hypothetical protein
MRRKINSIEVVPGAEMSSFVSVALDPENGGRINLLN